MRKNVQLWNNFKSNYNYRLIEPLNKQADNVHTIYRAQNLENGKEYAVKLFNNSFNDVTSAK